MTEAKMQRTYLVAPSLAYKLGLVTLLFFSSITVRGQSRQVEITGVIADSQHALLPGAAVAVTNEATGVKVSTSSNESGLYRVQNLIPGPYRVEISATGFKTFVR